MGRRWIGSSANQASLDRVLALINQNGNRAQGRLFIVRGEAGAGTSAFASRLRALLDSRHARTLYVPRMPFNSDFVFSSHVLKSLGLPPSVALTSGRRVERHYKAAMQLRRYGAVVCEDAHDFFHKHQPKVQGIYDSIQALTQPPYSHCVVLCGLYDTLTAVGHKATAMGIEVTFFDLEAMSCDLSYLTFVRDVIVANQGHRFPPYLPEANATALARTSTKTVNNPETPETPRMPETHERLDTPKSPSLAADTKLNELPILSSSESALAAEQAVLGAASFMALNQSPLTAQGIDVRMLHEHTKGLIGNTVSMLKGLLVDAEIAEQATAGDKVSRDVGMETALTEAVIGGNGSASKVDIPALPSMDDHAGDGTLYPAETPGGLQLLLPIGPPAVHQMEIQLELALDMPLNVHTGPKASIIAQGEMNSAIQQSSTRSIRQLKPAKSIVTPSVGDTSGSPETHAWEAAAIRTTRMSAACNKTPQGSIYKKRKLFQDLLTPIYDETLGSWLDRNANAGQASMIHQGFLDWCMGLLRLENESSKLSAGEGAYEAPWVRPTALDEQDGQTRPWDPNALLGTSRLRAIGVTVKELEYDDLYRSESFLNVFPRPLAVHLAERFTLPVNATAQHDNRRYCAQCLAGDVMGMKAPALRRAWRDRGAAVCTEHRQPVLLQQLEKGHLSKPAGAWQAFIQQTLNGHFDHGVGLVSRHSSGYQSASNETRVCRAVRRIQDWVANSPAIPSVQHPSKYCLYFILGFFLYQPNLVSDGGVARWFFKGMRGDRLDTPRYCKPTVSQMIKNIETAAPRSLAVGYLLLGTSFNLLAESETDLLRRELHFTEALFPKNRHELKLMALCFQRYHLTAVWESAVASLPAGDLIHLEWLFDKS
ncbi:TniQ family protein [Pseudomonas sp. CFBP 8772]|uniref:TniQ family protein n=2 Tax=Pseudomonas TaxID=286 RepID=UPI00177DF0F3|nr:TniQ family protein [Pseudomonas sp. CFBP 8772]MBD8597641.1 TniQ family protein [Pseudomonas sp. CFBP 8772]